MLRFTYVLGLGDPGGDLRHVHKELDGIIHNGKNCKIKFLLLNKKIFPKDLKLGFSHISKLTLCLLLFSDLYYMLSLLCGQFRKKSILFLYLNLLKTAKKYGLNPFPYPSFSFISLGMSVDQYYLRDFKLIIHPSY